VPGAAEFAYPTASLEEAQRLRSVVDGAPATALVTVVGGGPLGIETAAELAELGRTVTLVCGEQLGPYLHPRGRRSVAKGLSKLGVTVLDGPGAKVTTVTRDAVQLSDGRELPSTVTIWTAGFGVPDLAARSGLSTDALGRLLTDETLTSVDDERIVATGDAAAPSDLPLRMCCQAALPLGSHAADTVLSRIAGEQPADFSKGIAAMCVSLGRRAGVFQLAHRNDTAMRLHLSGRLGAKLKEAACKSPITQLADEARKPGSHTWPVKDAKRRQRLQAKARRGAGHPLNGQPAPRIGGGPVDYERIWTACRAAAPLSQGGATRPAVIGGPPSIEPSAARCVTAVHRAVSHSRPHQPGGSDRTATNERGPCCGCTA
jgi:NADH:ubiquinone reductase (H+-translocating)